MTKIKSFSQQTKFTVKIKHCRKALNKNKKDKNN